jgi:ATP-dependent Lon protease
MPNQIELPILPLRDPELVVFPGLFCEVDVGREFSLNAVSEANSKHNDIIIMAMQRDSSIEDPKAKDFFSICTEAEIKSILPLDKDGTRIRVILKGTRRALLKIVGKKDGSKSYLYGKIETIELTNKDISEEVKNMANQVREMVSDHLQFITIEENLTVTDGQSLSEFVDNIAGQLPISGKRRLHFLKLKDPVTRLEEVNSEVVDLCRQAEIEFDTSEESDDSEDPGQVAVSEVKKLQKKVSDANMPEHASKVAKSELRRLSMMPPSSSEFQVTYNYVDHLSSLPWDKMTEDNLDIDMAAKSLNDDHYGLEKPKERILEYLSVRKLMPGGKGPILCFYGPPGVGKAQPLNAKILTPNGFRTMGEIKIGDQVITPSGEISNVIGSFPQGVKDIYKILFSDGSSTECCREHLWNVQNRQDRLSNKKRTVNLDHMMGDLYIENNTRENYSIAMVSPDIDLGEGDLSLDPYLVGILISEGTGSKTVISNGDADIIQEVDKCLEHVDCHFHKYRNSEYDYRIAKNNHLQINNIRVDNKSAVTTFLDQTGLRICLSNTKFIPEEYKFSAAVNRERLLQGIMDGDGSPSSISCAIEWSSASIRLANDVQFIVQSLGGQARYSCNETYYIYNGETLQGKDRHRLRIALPAEINPFLCSRKSSIYRDNINKKRDLSRYVQSIEFVGKKEAKCILIDHPDHLYVTDDFIVTHNTSLGKSIAKAMGREFLRFSLGGVGDEAEIRGHRRTYVGAIPGRIMQYIENSGSRNPVFMLDEVDKMCANFRGDPSSALLEILDPEQNKAFVDHYLGVPFDLSQVLFIGTINDTTPLIPALRDRMEIIELPGYSPHDKVKIAQSHLVDKQKEENGLKDIGIKISNNAIGRIVDEYTSEAGVRSLERECGTIMRKIAVMVASGKEHPSLIKVDMIPKFLGPPKVFAEKAVKNPEVGLSAGLAWSQNGGCILFVETSLTPGEGKIKLTGNLGKVIQESANAAHTWIKSNAERLNVDLNRINKYDVHIHFPAGAVPKEGPSAGVAIAASMLSLVLDRPVRNDVAMTGEITLHGRILPIGGLKEKILAAHRAGIKEVLYPEHNKHDIIEIPSDVASDMILTPVSNLHEALKMIILDDVAEEESPNDMTPGDDELLMNMGA